MGGCCVTQPHEQSKQQQAFVSTQQRLTKAPQHEIERLTPGAGILECNLRTAQTAESVVIIASEFGQQRFDCFPT
jgi:hypothetical protein